ncbi:MAG: ABC transporter substrate-binding protein [Rhizobiaceae bacterium]|nr:ABC transporter substrate-binding protein [Rhizobiaceae bacterium]
MKKIAVYSASLVGAFMMMTGGAMAAPSCGLSNGQKANGEPIKVGAIVGQTGPDDFSSSGDAAQAFFKCINANGGVNGRPIEFTMEDDQWNPEVAAQVGNKLVKDVGVVALVGSGSFVDMAVNAKLYADEGVMSMAGACAISDCYESSNIVTAAGGPLISSVGAAQWAVAHQGAKNIVCVTTNIPTSGIYGCSWMQKFMENKGLEASIIPLDPASADMNSAVLETIASGADTVLVNMPGGMAAAFLKVAEEQDLRDNFKWISSTPLYDADIPAALGKYWTGVLTVNAELNPIDGTGPDTTNWRAIMETYANEGDPRDTFSQAGYLAAKYFVEAVLKLDPADINRASVTKAIQAISGKTSDMMCGPYYVGLADRHLPNHANIMMQLVDGGFKQVSECTQVDTEYLAPYLAIEKEMGISN